MTPSDAISNTCREGIREALTVIECNCGGDCCSRTCTHWKLKRCLEQILYANQRLRQADDLLRSWRARDEGPSGLRADTNHFLVENAKQ